MPTRLCIERTPDGHGCPHPATRRGRCDEHRKAYERERSARRRASTTQGQAVKVYHSAKWRNTREAVLNRDPICKVCDNALSTQVDHIIPLSEGGDSYKLAGLQGICVPCHVIKSAGESLAAGDGR